MNNQFVLFKLNFDKINYNQQFFSNCWMAKADFADVWLKLCLSVADVAVVWIFYFNNLVFSNQSETTDVYVFKIKTIDTK